MEMRSSSDDLTSASSETLVTDFGDLLPVKM
jgi:hypothetical protein